MHPLTDACPPVQTAHSAQAGRVGAVLDGKYAIVRLLGQGGMGEVYEARHTKIGRRLAVKFLHGQFAKRPEVARRFENEARAAGEVEHENIAGVYDVGVLPDGTQYLVMEYLDGEDLGALLRRDVRVPLARAAELLTQACLGLDVVHRRGIVHRDLKPANLFLTRRANGTDLVKVLDFGIAKLRRPEGDAGATGTGVALGTAYYMSPEQARGEREIDARSDVYALGVIFYELLSGRRPHEGDSLLRILHQILTQPPTPLEEVSPGLPAPVYRIVRKAMAPRAADRFGSASELADVVAPFAGPTYRPSQVPGRGLEATHLETAGVVGQSSGGVPVQSVVGVTRSAVPASKAKSIALVASIVTVIAVVAGGVAAVHRSAETTTAIGATASSPSPVSPVPVAGPTPPVATTPPIVATIAPASPSATSADAAKDADTQAAPELRKVDGPRHHGGSGASRATHDAPLASAPSALPAATAPPESTAPKLDCTQTYTIDSEGNKHFRPECFSK